jgi:hypothetical protein
MRPIERPDDREVALLRKSRIADSILLSWGLTELIVDGLILTHFAVEKHDEATKEFLTRRDFETKVNFLSKMGILTTEETKRIKDFKKERNSLFHSPKGGFLPLLSREERKILRRLGEDSVRAGFYAYGRLRKNELDEESRDWVAHESSGKR